MLVMEYVDGVAMARLSDEQKSVVRVEVEGYLERLHQIRSDTLGGPSGIVVPPYRVMDLEEGDEWERKVSNEKEYVFCHNDLSQHNVIVDPETLKVRAILDWEYAGFFPVAFEGSFYKRPGPSVALEGEYDDSRELLQFMKGYLGPDEVEEHGCREE